VRRDRSLIPQQPQLYVDHPDPFREKTFRSHGRDSIAVAITNGFFNGALALFFFFLALPPFHDRDRPPFFIAEFQNRYYGDFLTEGPFFIHGWTFPFRAISVLAFRNPPPFPQQNSPPAERAGALFFFLPFLFRAGTNTWHVRRNTFVTHGLVDA